MPTVFISYSWDSTEHKAWVRRLAGDLREAGVEVWLDQDHVRPGDDITHFMERGVAEADFVILVCTEPFAHKANERTGGIGYEQAIVTAAFLHSQPARGRFVCVLRGGTPSSALPRYMQTRLWLDFRDDAQYAESLQQMRIHVLDLYAREAAAGATSARMQGEPATGAEAAGEPACWVLVAGTGAKRGFTPELEDLSRRLGTTLMTQRCGLVTGGWPGVDEWVARAFADRAQALNIALEDVLQQVVPVNGTPAFGAGQLVFVRSGAEEWNEPIRRADAVLLLGGLGGTWTTGEVALRMRKPVFPVADTGGDAQAFYLHMLKHWADLAWLGLSQKEFSQLARPGHAGVAAAVQLAQRTGNRSRTQP